MMQNTLSEKLFQHIVTVLVNAPDSPYHQLLRKVNDIDTDYFEDIPRDEDVLSPELNLNLRVAVIHDFEELGQKLIHTSGLAASLLDDLQKQLLAAGTEVDEALPALKHELTQYAADRLLFLTPPPYEMVELEKLYDEARKISLMERVLQNNESDVIAFHHALQERTVWDCTTYTEKYVAAFLKELADKL